MSGGKPPADDLLRPRETRLALRNFDAASMGAAVSIGGASRAACTGIVATLSCPALHVMAPGQQCPYMFTTTADRVVLKLHIVP